MLTLARVAFLAYKQSLLDKKDEPRLPDFDDLSGNQKAAWALAAEAVRSALEGDNRDMPGMTKRNL